MRCVIQGGTQCTLTVLFLSCCAAVFDVDRNQRIKRYLPLVERIARRMLVRLPASVTWEELVSAGYLGLIEAVDRYDDERASNFSAFARPRIRGAMLDSLRELDVLPRSTRERINALNAAREKWFQDHGRRPTDQELAQTLELTLEQVRKLQRYERQSQLVRFDAPVQENDPQEKLLDRLIDERALDGQSRIHRQEAEDEIQRAFDSLAERLRMVIILYYVEELTMREIAEVMSLTTGRISQLHSEAIDTLRASLITVSDLDPHTLSVLFVQRQYTDT